MTALSEVAQSLIGRKAVDGEGRRLGRVFAVIHKARGADVLIEGRRWWIRRRTYRCPLHRVSVSAAGTVVVDLDGAHAVAEAAVPRSVGAQRR